MLKMVQEQACKKLVLIISSDKAKRNIEPLDRF